MSEQILVVEKDEGVGTIRLNRPDVLNALSRDVYSQLDDAVSDMEADDEVMAVIFTGTGERAFSAGADIHEMARLAENPDAPPPDPRRPTYAWHVASCTKPTGSGQRSSPRLALLRMPPRRRARKTCSSASLMVPLSPSNRRSLKWAGS